MTKRLTAVPMIMAEIIAIDNGFCNSLPISKVNNKGTIPKIVVNEVKQRKAIERFLY